MVSNKLLALGFTNSVVFYFLWALPTVKLILPCFFFGLLVSLSFFYSIRWYHPHWQLYCLSPSSYSPTLYSVPNEGSWRPSLLPGGMGDADPNMLFLSQSKYIQDLLTRFHLTQPKPVHTPLSSRTTLSLMDRDLISDPTKYQSMVGAL